MTHIAIPCITIPPEDAERLADIAARARCRLAPMSVLVEEAYRLGAAHRSDYAAHLETALSEIAIDRIGAVREDGVWTVTCTSDNDSRDGEGATFVEALCAAVEAVVEMRAAAIIRVGDRVRVKAGCFVPPHLSHQMSVGYASNEEYLQQHRGSLEGVVTDIDGDIVRLDGALQGHRIERYERVPTHDEGAALLSSKAGR